MNTHADQTHQNKTQIAANAVPQKQSDGNITSTSFIDNRPGAVAQRKLQSDINNSPRIQQLKARNNITDNRTPAITQRKKNLEEEENTVQKKANKTGLPDNLKSGIERLSNLSMDDVKVHYNSDKPKQMQAHAYAQGTDIHLAPGQEKHLPHEAWHVVQQAQGRVKKTRQMKGGIPVNDNTGLELEADVMGTKALSGNIIENGTVQPVQGKFTRIQGHKAILQAMWIEVDSDDENQAQYMQLTEIEGRIWEVKLSNGKVDEDKPSDDLYRYEDEKGESAWKSVAEWTQIGISPPLGARFQNQRDQEKQTQDDAQDYAFKATTLVPGTPLKIKQAHKLLTELVQHTRIETQQDLDLLDNIIAGEFKQISVNSKAIADAVKNKRLNNNQLSTLNEFFSRKEISDFANIAMTADQIEKLEAGLRYKRVYEHEQNIITIQRRARADVDKISLIVAQKYELDIEIDEEDEQTHTIRAMGFEGKNYDLGTLNFGDARFEQIQDALQVGGSAIYQHKETQQQHVQDRNDHYTPRFITRAIRYEDAVAILENKPMPTKMGYNDKISGKEASDYGPGFEAGDKINHNEKVVGQIRGYARFLSATTSEQMATSTSRGTYDSPFGSVKIDLAQMPKTGYTEAHSEEAMDEIYGIPDLGQVEYIPKHLKDEAATVKAGRDAYRAREIVIDSPPVNAVTTIPRKSKEVGLAIIGISSTAKKENIEAAVGKWAPNVSFIEVNVNYQRTIDKYTGRTAFVFFKGISDTDEVKAHLEEKRGSNKINEKAGIVEVPSSEELNEHQNPAQIEKQSANQKLLKKTTPKLTATLDALKDAHSAKLPRKKRAFIYQVILQITALQKNLNTNANGDVETQKYSALVTEAINTTRAQRQAIIDNLDFNEIRLPELAKLRKYR